MFKVNQDVVCIKRGNWMYTDPNAAQIFPGGCPHGPKFNEVLTIFAIIEKKRGLYLSFSQYSNHNYSAKWFQPLVDDSVLSGELAEICEQIIA